jgi:hypothetical protein
MTRVPVRWTGGGLDTDAPQSWQVVIVVFFMVILFINDESELRSGTLRNLFRSIGYEKTEFLDKLRNIAQTLGHGVTRKQIEYERRARRGH